MANIVEQAIIELQSVYKGGGAEKAKKDLANLKRELKDANGSVHRLQNSLKQLNRVPIAFDDKRAMGGAGGQTTPRKAAIFAANEALREYFNTIKSGKRQLAGTEAGLRAQSAAFNKVAANAKVAGDLYVGAVESQTRAEQKLRLAQIERIKVEKDLYATGRVVGNDAFKGVDELLRYGKTLPQITAALSVYKNELQRTLSVVEIGGEKYKKLKTEIQRVTEVMQGPQATKKGLAGLKESLADAKKEQQELVVGRAGTKEWVEATVRVKKAQFEYNKELAKSRIGVSLINADINGSVRALNLAKQAAKGGLGLLGGVAGAIGGAGKKALGTRLGKIGAARGIDALAKKVPVVDKAFGRLLQKIPLLGKFLNENISVNARWSAQILEGITGVTLAWNGLNQIISAAQAFTAFERQAAIAINRVARMFKEMYNVAGAMMMGLISPGQVGKNLWDQALDRPDVMAARRGPSSIERLELQQAKKKAELKNTEIRDEGRLQVISRQILEIENAITDETRQRVLLAKQYQDAMMKGPVWTQYGSPAGPGAKGAGFLSSMEGNLGEAKLRLAEKVTIEGKEYENAARAVVQIESQINAELRERDAIYKRLNQGVALTKQQQQDAATSLAAQRETEGIDFRGRTVSRRGFQRYQRMRQGRRDRRQRFNENMMLGVGFPMLFGGGLGGIAGGAAGAVAQSKMGTKGGFGAQIILSAIGQKFDQIVGQMLASTTKLAQATSPYVKNISELARSLGAVNNAEGQRLKLIEQTHGSQAAFNEGMKQLKYQIGEEGVQALERYGDKTIALSNAWNRFTTGVWAGIANLLDKLGILDGATATLNWATKDKTVDARMMADLGEGDAKIRANTMLGLEQQISDENTKIAQLEMFGKSTVELRKQRDLLQEQLDLHREILAPSVIELDQKLQKKAIQEFVLKDINEENKLLQNQLKHGMERGALETEIAKRIKEANDLATDGVKIDEQKIRNAVLYNDQVKKQLALWSQIKDTIATGLTSAIQGLIDGTKSLGESLANIAKQIGSMLLQSAIMGWLAPVGLPKIPGGTAKAAEGMYMANGIRPFASGGLATRPTLGLVGEAGEDEYIIPASKMASSMQRYSAGVRGEAVIPGTGSSYAGGGAGGSTTVNYSGPILNFNSEEFVPKSAVGQIIATATSHGARAGENRTLTTLRNSRSARSRLGM